MYPPPSLSIPELVHARGEGGKFGAGHGETFGARTHISHGSGRSSEKGSIVLR